MTSEQGSEAAADGQKTSSTCRAIRPQTADSPLPYALFFRHFINVS
ncbi:hypothetical protein B4113_1879 [Geobacillus sp. B4113_201601]|nr:hypothetical protein B4113_1879 [Geobacillus sp. B4113_201601]